MPVHSCYIRDLDTAKDQLFPNKVKGLAEGTLFASAPQLQLSHPNSPNEF
jgi:hypothetical protein